ncbi:MAG: DUF192 domain-containing protein [Desulfuromonadales bacterium]
MKAINTANNSELAENLICAETLQSRMVGLLGRQSLANGEGLWIKPCKGVHTFGMHFPIDVVFLDPQLRVIGVSHALPPNRLTRLYISAASVLELPSGVVAQTATVAGDTISIN